MPHMKRKLTLLLMCLLLLGGVAMASGEKIEADASEEISVETESLSEETPVDADPSAKDYINYYLMPADSPYLETSEAVNYAAVKAGEIVGPVVHLQISPIEDRQGIKSWRCVFLP